MAIEFNIALTDQKSLNTKGDIKARNVETKSVRIKTIVKIDAAMDNPLKLNILLF